MVRMMDMCAFKKNGYSVYDKGMGAIENIISKDSEILCHIAYCMW